MTDDPRLKDFETCKAALDKLGVKYYVEHEYRGPVGPERKEHEVPLFRSVVLPFTPDIWMSLVRNGGENYIGGCCGSSSAMQDRVCDWFRMEDGGVAIEELSELAEAQIEHDGDESPFHHIERFPLLFEQAFREVAPGQARPWAAIQTDPWAAMAVIWHLTKNHYTQKKPAAYGDHMTPVEKSLHMVMHVCRAISWERLFSEKDSDGTPLGPTSQEKVIRTMYLARFLPALKMLNEHVSELYHGPLDGFAIIEREKGPMAVAENGRGYCIFETEVEAQALFDRWDENDALFEERREPRPARERFALRPVRVTLEDGIVFTDTGERYTGKNE